MGSQLWAGVAPPVGVPKGQSKAPSPSTMLRVFRGIDTEQLEGRLTQWAERVPQVLEPLSAGELEPVGLEAIAVDGKSLRCSRGMGADNAHLLIC